MNKGFGPQRSPHLEQIATPIGWKCLRCDEEIVEGDSGEIQAYIDEAGPRPVAQHRECLIRAIAGSVGHQLGVCSCPGKPGWMDDPAGLTKRQAAILAERLFMKLQGGTAHDDGDDGELH